MDFYGVGMEWDDRHPCKKDVKRPVDDHICLKCKDIECQENKRLRAKYPTRKAMVSFVVEIPREFTLKMFQGARLDDDGNVSYVVDMEKKKAKYEIEEWIDGVEP